VSVKKVKESTMRKRKITFVIDEDDEDSISEYRKSHLDKKGNEV